MSGMDDKLVAAYMKSLNDKGEYTVSEEIFAQIKDAFVGGCCDDVMTKDTIAKIKNEYNYTADTHTAVAIKVYEEYVNESGDNTKTIIASTANPYKFNKSVLEALTDEELDGCDEFELLNKLSETSGMQIPSSLSTLKEKDVRFTAVCDKNNMKSTVSEFLK
jgi:threonine synthase